MGKSPDGIDTVGISRTLLRIVAQLPKTKYSEVTSTDQKRREEVLIHPDTADPASASDTSQG